MKRRLEYFGAASLSLILSVSAMSGAGAASLPLDTPFQHGVFAFLQTQSISDSGGSISNNTTEAFVDSDTIMIDGEIDAAGNNGFDYRVALSDGEIGFLTDHTDLSSFGIQFSRLQVAETLDFNFAGESAGLVEMSFQTEGSFLFDIPVGGQAGAIFAQSYAVVEYEKGASPFIIDGELENPSIKLAAAGRFVEGRSLLYFVGNENSFLYNFAFDDPSFNSILVDPIDRIEFEERVSLSFVASASKSYGIIHGTQIEVETGFSARLLIDFLNTTTLAVDSVAGGLGSFSSASGRFPGSSNAPSTTVVPVPPALVFLPAGLLLLAGLGRRRS